MKNKITMLDSSVDLWIAHSWFDPSIKNATEHNICGHTFEVLEYFWKLKDYFNCKMLWPEYNPTWEKLEIAIREKYNFSDDEINIIKNSSEFHQIPKLLKGNNILLVDGEIDRIRLNILLFKQVFMFACGDKKIAERVKDKKYIVLQDESDSSYGKVYEPGENTINYKKKLLLDRYNLPDINHNGETKTLLYLTTNCRELSLEYIENLINTYNNTYYKGISNTWIIATNDVSKYSILSDKYNIEILEAPIEDFRNKFNNYIYTPIERKWDCSNRLLVECKHFKYTFEFDKTYDKWEEYIKEDKALLSRKFDIVSNFDNLNLTNDNDIVEIIKEHIC